MDDIKKDIREINEKLDKLARHIDFVESTYTIIKRPMAYVCSKIIRWVPTTTRIEG